MAFPTWERRELAILRAIVAHDEDDRPLMSDDLERELPDFPPRALTVGLQALIDGGYVIASDGSSFNQVTFINVRLSAEGRRTVGQWPPTDAYDALLERLEVRASNTDDIDQRGRIERVREAIVALGREVTAELIADVLRRGG